VLWDEDAAGKCNSYVLKGNRCVDHFMIRSPNLQMGELHATRPGTLHAARNFYSKSHELYTCDSEPGTG
jgi:hypothetical protein